MNLNTNKIKAEPITAQHKQPIEQVLSENKAMLDLLSAEVSIEDETQTILNYSDLPKNVKIDQLNAYLLSDPDSNDPLGLLTFLSAYPSNNTIYIGTLFLRPYWQRKGIGTHIVNQIHQQQIAEGYTESKVLVGLRNWPALRFWTKLGYSSVTNIKGDATFGDHHFCSIELTRRCS